MLPYPLLLIYRNFKRFKSTFFINLIGLSTGLAGALVSSTSGLATSAASTATTPWTDGCIRCWKTTARPPASRRKPVPCRYWPRPYGGKCRRLNSWPPPRRSRVFFPPFTLAAGGQHLTAVAKYADPAFFQLFSYPLLVGTPATVLRDKHAIVLSEALATKLFGSPQNSLGKAVEWQMMTDSKQTSLVAGVFAGVPRNSSEQFDCRAAICFVQGPDADERNHQVGRRRPLQHLLSLEGRGRPRAVSSQAGGFVEN